MIRMEHISMGLFFVIFLNNFLKTKFDILGPINPQPTPLFHFPFGIATLQSRGDTKLARCQNLCAQTLYACK